MTILDDLRVLFKLNPAQPGIAATEGEADPENIVDFQKSFDEIEIIHRSIELIINAACDLPFSVKGGAEKKVTKLLNTTPNPFEDRNRFFRRALLDFYLDGNTFIYYDKEAEGGALYIIPANDMSIIPNSKTFIDHYEYQPLAKEVDPFRVGGRARQEDNDSTGIRFDANEIIHIKSDSQDSIYRGDSKLKSLKRIIELYYSMISFQRQFFKNNAVPGVVLTTDNVLSPKVKMRLLADWSQSYSTIFKGARSPAILDGGLKIDSFSKINFQELDFEASIDRIQQDMAKALGVPYVLMKSGNNANIAPNQVLLYTNTVIPLMSQFASAFSLRFPGSEVTVDKQAITALRPDIKAQAAFWSTLVNGGIATANEAREGLRLNTELNKIDDEECDHIRIPQNITGSATNPSLGGRPGNSNNDSGE